MITHKTIVMAAMAVCISACASDNSLAPKPPSFTAGTYQLAERDSISTLQTIEPAAGMVGVPDFRAEGSSLADAGKEYDSYTGYNGIKNILKRDGCHIKDRFDRKELVAYQWGRNRLGVDVDGIGFDSMEMEKIKMTYRLKFQSHKSKKEKCRYKSSWQGIVGSGYNEFYLREDDTVMQRVKALRREVSGLFD